MWVIFRQNCTNSAPKKKKIKYYTRINVNDVIVQFQLYIKIIFYPNMPIAFC